eukprot:CAMPEP_0197852528 /NCGR_PEP_ID=MMETSP1438-20131217/20809_1 /TAXON_ID=1461541 /ORGANISM="Pterosperma sp., Strain CCMP1384" /LENGTH=260 /DNA_ID=CAMNT_0043466617 /DNA_START=324 /DNA_END=1106 /DNA_ORIENTATION=+
MWRSIQLFKTANKCCTANPWAQRLLVEARTTSLFPAAACYSTLRSLPKSSTLPFGPSALNTELTFARTVGSQLATQSTQIRLASSQTQKDSGKVKEDSLYAQEEEFDEITDKIPVKPVTVVEGASYGIVIVVALGIAAAAAYAVFTELFMEAKEFTVFNVALERIKQDPRVTMRLGESSSITGYGSNARSRGARQRIRHKEYYGPDGQLHVAVNFFARGSKEVAEVHCDMYKDESGEWKYQYLYLEFGGQFPQRVIIEAP